MVSKKTKVILIASFFIVSLLFYQMRMDRLVVDNKLYFSEDSYIENFKQLDSLLDFDSNKAEILIDKYLSYSDEQLNLKTKGYLFYFKIVLDLRKNKKDNILYYADKVEVYGERMKDDFLKAKLDIQRGLYHLYTDNFPNSFFYLFRAESYFEEKRDYESLSDVYSVLGGVYSALGEMGKAKHYYTEAYDISVKIKNKRHIAVIKANLGHLNILLKEYDKAKSDLYYSYEIFESLKDYVNIVKVHLNISRIEIKQTNYAASLNSLNQVEPLLELIDNSKFLSTLTFLNYGYVYENIGDYEKAVINYKRAYNGGINNKIHFPIEVIDGVLRLSKILEQQSRFEEALFYMEKYIDLKEKMVGVQVLQSIQNIELRMVEARQKAELEMSRRRHVYLRYVYLIFLVIMVSTVMFIGFLYRNKNKLLKMSEIEKQRLSDFLTTEKELSELKKQQHDFEQISRNELKSLQEEQFKLNMDSKNIELNLLSIQLISKSRVFIDILKVLEDRSVSSNAKVNKLTKKIRLNKEMKKDWEHFKDVFQKIHPEFFNELETKYPDLTKSEVRVCAFIRIGMSNIEISDLLNINQASIITTRYRIRKKMNLKRLENLDKILKEM